MTVGYIYWPFQHKIFQAWNLKGKASLYFSLWSPKVNIQLAFFTKTKALKLNGEKKSEVFFTFFFHYHFIAWFFISVLSLTSCKFTCSGLKTHLQEGSDWDDLHFQTCPSPWCWQLSPELAPLTWFTYCMLVWPITVCFSFWKGEEEKTQETSSPPDMYAQVSLSLSISAFAFWSQGTDTEGLTQNGSF